MKTNYPKERRKIFPDLQWKGTREAELVDCAWMMETNRAKAHVIERWNFKDDNSFYFRFSYYTWSEDIDQIRWGGQTAPFVPDSDIPDYMKKIFGMMPQDLKQRVLENL